MYYPVQNLVANWIGACVFLVVFMGGLIWLNSPPDHHDRCTVTFQGDK